MSRLRLLTVRYTRVRALSERRGIARRVRAIQAPAGHTFIAVLTLSAIMTARFAAADGVTAMEPTTVA